MASDNSFYIGIPAFGAQVPINYDSSCPKYIQITGISQSVEDVGTYYDYTMELVDPSSLTSNTYIIHYCNTSSEKYIRSWMNYSSDIFAEIPRLRRVEMEKVLSLLDDYQHQCEMDKSEKEQHPTVNSAKFMELKALFEKEAEKLEHILESNDEYKPGVVITSDVLRSCSLETLNYSAFMDIDCKCVPSVHCTNFWNDIVRDYLRNLCNLKRIGDFKVSRKQLKNVLQTMGLNDDYTIISTEKVDELPDNSINLKALLNVKWFFVVKKSETPRIRLQPIDDKNLLPIKEGGAICSNLEEFQSCNISLFKLQLGTKLSFSVPNDFSGYVRFTIVDTQEAQEASLMPKDTFEDLFKVIKDDSTNAIKEA